MNYDLLDLLKVKIGYSAERHKVLAENIASLDIPGYRAKDLAPLNFKNVLQSQIQHVGMAVTSDMHLTGTKIRYDNFKTVQNRNPYDITPTKNDVVVEDQMSKVAANAVDFELSTNLYKKLGTWINTTIGK
jgi:flagellar basal-body rod protein FlgB